MMDATQFLILTSLMFFLKLAAHFLDDLVLTIADS